MNLTVIFLRGVILTGATLLANCTAPRPSPEPTTQPKKPSITRRLQNNWDRCLDQSYQVTRTKTPDKNAAAELAFQACSSEEQDLVSASYAAPMLQPHLRAETKRVLIDDGHLPIFDE